MGWGLVLPFNGGTDTAMSASGATTTSSTSYAWNMTDADWGSSASCWYTITGGGTVNLNLLRSQKKVASSVSGDFEASNDVSAIGVGLTSGSGEFDVSGLKPCAALKMRMESVGASAVSTVKVQFGYPTVVR